MIQFAFGTKLNPIPEIAGKDWESKRPLWKQVHGVVAKEVSQSSQQCGEVDALWTRAKNFPVAVITADCVPVLLHHPEAVGAVHSGWRGLFQNNLECFFQALPSEFSDRTQWRAKIGPAIHACCYEVSAELIADFVKKFPQFSREQIEPTSRHLDLIRIAKGQLENLGVVVESVSEECTFCTLLPDGSPKYCSYRRGDRFSRQYSVISLSE